MTKLLPILAAVAFSVASVAPGYGQSPAELRHDQIKNEREAEHDMAAGNYRAAKQHQRRAKSDEEVRQSRENQQLEYQRGNREHQGSFAQSPR